MATNLQELILPPIPPEIPAPGEIELDLAINALVYRVGHIAAYNRLLEAAKRLRGEIEKKIGTPS